MNLPDALDAYAHAIACGAPHSVQADRFTDSTASHWARTIQLYEAEEAVTRVWDRPDPQPRRNRHYCCRCEQVIRTRGSTMRRSAHVDGDYRYTLDRHWGADETSQNILHLVMLNPSIADGLSDDPTIRRCIGYAQALGLDGLRVINLFALRSTDPRGLRTHSDPIGPRNDEILTQCMRTLTGNFMVAAWGADKFAIERAKAVHAMAASRSITLKCWGKTKDGHPGHPLYLRRTAELVDWNP